MSVRDKSLEELGAVPSTGLEGGSYLLPRLRLLRTVPLKLRSGSGAVTDGSFPGNGTHTRTITEPCRGEIAMSRPSGANFATGLRRHGRNIEMTCVARASADCPSLR